MIRKSLACAVLATCALLTLTGCMPKMTIEQMKASMPERPAELDRLDAFVGKWEWTGSAEMAGLEEPLTMTGTSEMHWESDRGFLVSRANMNMEPFGESEGIETWTYDSKAKKYRSTWTGGMGMISMGETVYDEKNDIWRMKGTGYGPMGKSSAKGTMKFTDADTMEWEMTEYSGLMKIMTMSGTGHRVE